MTVQRFLVELDEAARTRLDPAYASSLRAELVTHLEADVQARLELGEPRERAEQEAIKALGPLEKLIYAASKRNSRKRVIDPRVLTALIASHLTLAALVGYGTGIEKWPSGFQILIPTALLGFAAWLAVAAYRARALQWALSLLLLLPLTAIYSISLAVTSAAPHDFFSLGSTPYNQLPQLIKSAESRAKAATDKESEFNRALEKRILMAANGKLSTEEALLGPRWKPFEAGYDLHRFKSADEALRAWLKVAPKATHYFTAERGAALSWMFELSEQQARPYWMQVVFHLPQGALISGWLSLFTFGIVTFSWLLRRVVEGIRDRWRMRAA